jgi:hypothetical protein
MFYRDCVNGVLVYLPALHSFIWERWETLTFIGETVSPPRSCWPQIWRHRELQSHSRKHQKTYSWLNCGGLDFIGVVSDGVASPGGENTEKGRKDRAHPESPLLTMDSSNTSQRAIIITVHTDYRLMEDF